MWDEVRDRPQASWDRLPKSLRIVAFSKAVALTRPPQVSLCSKYSISKTLQIL